MSGGRSCLLHYTCLKSTTINSRCLMLFKPGRSDDAYERFLEKSRELHNARSVTPHMLMEGPCTKGRGAFNHALFPGGVYWRSRV